MMTTNRKRLGIYIHIPFCKRKCKYCDFLSFECLEADNENIQKYIIALIDEICFYSRFRENYIVDSIFIGGGTPSLIDKKYIVKIIETLKECFDVEKTAEITIEANPKTLDMDKLKAYLKAGVNRLSVGVQSFDDDILSILGRIHSVNDIYDTFHMAREAGFENISIDLMSAVPGLDIKSWEDALKKAVKLNPEHISFYSLQIEEETPFYEMFERGELTCTTEEEDRSMYHKAISFLKEKGYMQYEISNAAKEGFESEHNLKYWSMDEYLGMGLGASSYLRIYENMNGRFYEKAGYSLRFSNTKDMKEYISSEKKKKDGWNICTAAEEIHENSFFDDASEFVFTGLRKTEGISFLKFYEFTGKHFFDVFGENKKGYIEKWVEEGFAVLEKVYDRFGDERDYFFKLTVSGFDISNSILMEFV